MQRNLYDQSGIIVVYAFWGLRGGNDKTAFIGAAAQYACSEALNQDEDAFNFQIAGGVKHFIHPQVVLSAEVNYNMATEDIYGDGSAQDDKTQILFGTRFYF